MIRKSIQNDLGWTAFEENGPRLWAAIRTNVSIFMNSLWEQGGLLGDTASSAYNVTCDSTTTSIQDILDGKVHRHRELGAGEACGVCEYGNHVEVGRPEPVETSP